MYDSSGKLTDQFGRLVSETAAAKNGLKAVSDEARFASESADEAASAFSDIGEAAIVGGGAVVAGVGLAVKAYADFDKQMSSVDAATHETAGNMDLLRQAAIDAGADTAFSAGEAAQGIEELAKAGVSTKDILGGGLNGSLALAAAGSLDVGQAAEIAASALTQFKLSGDQVPHVADLLAAGAGKAQGSVEDLGAALNQSGLVAASTGLTIEETTGALSAFASAGLTGSDAGTSFKTMLMSLNPNSKEAALLMDELGIKAYDAQGKFVGMSEYAGVLQGALKNMSDEQRNATLKTLFGSDAVRAANVLYEQGAAGINKWETAVNDSGFAAETAARMQNNLAGDLEKLGGSFDTVLIQSGHGANDVLRGMVQGLEGVVDAVGKVPAPTLAAGGVVAGLTGGVVLFGGVLTTVMPKIAATRLALATIAPAGTLAGAALSRAGALAAGAAAGFATIAAASILAKPGLEQILKPTGETGDALEAFGGQAAKGAVGADTLSKSFQDLVQHKDGVNDFQAAIDGIADPGIWGNIDNILVGTTKVLTLGMADVTSTSDTARQRMKALGEQLASLDAGKASSSFQSMAKSTDGSSKTLTQLIDLMPGYRAKLEEQAKASGFATDDQTLLNLAMGKLKISTSDASTATEKYTDATGKSVPVSEEMAKQLEEIGVSADGSVADLDKFTEALFRATHTNLSAREAARGFQESIDAVAESVVANGKTLDINTDKGRANQAALDKIANSGLAVVESNAKNGDSQEKLQGNLDATYQALIDGAGQFDITGQAAIDLAREVLHVPPGVDIKTWMDDQAKRIAQDTKAALDAIPKNVNININTNKTTFERLVGLPSTTADGTYGQGLGVLAPQTKAAGGPIFGPGTGTSDDVPAWLSNGEHVWTAEEVRAAGGHGAVESLRSLALKGLPAFATGGRVGWSDRNDDRQARIAAAATNKREALASARWHAQQAYDKIGSSAKNKSRKAAANRALKAAEKRLTSAENAEDRAKGKLRDAKERTARLSESTRDLKTEVRRGDIVGSVMSGSGLSVVDRLRDESRNKDLSGYNRGRLGRVANSSEKQLISLEKRSDSLASKLEKAKSKFDELVSIQSGVASGLKSEQSISGFMSGLDDKAAAKSQKNLDKVTAKHTANLDKITAKLEAARSIQSDLYATRDSVSSGLKGGFSLAGAVGLIDEKAAAALGKSTEKAQSGLDKITGKLDAAQGKLDSLRAARDGIRDGLRGEQSLGSALGQQNSFGYDVPVTSKSLVAGARSKLAAIKAFATKLQKLRGMGLSGRILDEVAGLGSEDGAQVADALIKGGAADVKSLNSAYSGISKWGQIAGSAISDSMYKGGVGAAKSLVDGLESQQEKVTAKLTALTAKDPSGKVTAKGLVSNASGMASRIKAFAGKLGKLQKEGLSGTILEEIAGMGVEEGSRVADALLAGTGSDVKDLNRAYERIGRWSNKAGSAVASGMYKGGISAANSLVAGLESQQSRVQSTLESLVTPDAAGKITASGMAKGAKATADRISKFAWKLGKLQKRGVSGAILEEIAGMGTEEGMRAADALLAGSDWSIEELNTQYRRIDKYSQKAGLNVAKGFYDGGVNAAKGLVAGLEDQQGAIEKQMLKIAKGMEAALKKALGIKSPSTKARGWMHHVGDGAVLGLEDMQPAVESAMSAMVSIPQTSFGSWSGMVQSGSSMSAPVMELSAADRALMSQFITASHSMPPMTLLVNGRQAGAIVQEGNKAVRTLK